MKNRPADRLPRCITNNHSQCTSKSYSWFYRFLDIHWFIIFHVCFLHNFRVVELSRVYHTIPQSASKTKRTTDWSRWFSSPGGGWSIRNFTSQAPASFRSALVGRACPKPLPGTSTINWNLSGQGPSICSRRPFGHLKAPLGLSLLRKREFSN